MFDMSVKHSLLYMKLWLIQSNGIKDARDGLKNIRDLTWMPNICLAFIFPPKRFRLR